MIPNVKYGREHPLILSELYKIMMKKIISIELVKQMLKLLKNLYWKINLKRLLIYKVISNSHKENIFRKLKNYSNLFALILKHKDVLLKLMLDTVKRKMTGSHGVYVCMEEQTVTSLEFEIWYVLMLMIMLTNSIMNFQLKLL